MNGASTKPYDARLAAWLVAPLIDSPVTPNHLTFVRFVVGMAGAVMFGLGDHPVAAAVLVILSNFLDHTDGELARMSGKTSRFGHYFDLASDALVTVGMFVGIGIGLVGLTQYAVWALFAFTLTLPGIVGFVGLANGSIPSIPVGTLVAFVVFFLLGYFVYAGLYAAFAAPFNSDQEAQQFVMIPGMMLIISAMTWIFAYNTPDGTFARVLSIFPFTSPLLMFMRISVQPPPAWEIALSIGLLLLTIWGVSWFAGRVYRVGILMYGKKPTFPEIIRWVRAAD